MPGLWASIGVTHSYPSHPFLCALVGVTRSYFSCLFLCALCFSYTQLLYTHNLSVQTRQTLALSLGPSRLVKLADFWAGPGDEATQALCIDRKVTGYHPLLNEGWVGLHTLLQEKPVMNKLLLAGVLIVLASYPGCMGGGRRPGNLWRYSGNGCTCTNSRYQAVFLLPRSLGMRL